MAIYHLHAQVIGRSTGRSAVASSAYRSGEKLYNEQTGKETDYRKKSGVVEAGILTPEGVPDWMKNREQLWNNVEVIENRKNSQFCKEYDIALPHELSKEKNAEMLKAFCQEQFVSKGLIVDYAIHDPQKQKNREEGKSENMHAHVMQTLRQADENGWNKNKYRDGNNVDELNKIREAWASRVNQTFEKEGINQKIDHRTLEAQGINRDPQQHAGIVATAIERKNESRKPEERIPVERTRTATKEEREPEIKETAEIKALKEEKEKIQNLIQATDDPEKLQQLMKQTENATNRETNERSQKMYAQIITEYKKALELEIKKREEALKEKEKGKPDIEKRTLFNKSKVDEQEKDYQKWQKEIAKEKDYIQNMIAHKKELEGVNLKDAKQTIEAGAKLARENKSVDSMARAMRHESIQSREPSPNDRMKAELTEIQNAREFTQRLEQERSNDHNMGLYR